MKKEYITSEEAKVIAICQYYIDKPLKYDSKKKKWYCEVKD